MSKSSVRDAFETSVAWTRPPVRRQIRNDVDGAERELAALGARAQAGRLASRMWRIFGPQK